MEVTFIPKGRLGNALFRYMACSIICIKYNSRYVHGRSQTSVHFDDQSFINWMHNPTQIHYSVIMSGFYQHDKIYTDHKKQLLNYISDHKDHIITTDGIQAGDGHIQTFNVHKLISGATGPVIDMVLHVRLGDHMTHGWNIKVGFLIDLLGTIELPSIVHIVTAPITTADEQTYMDTLNTYLTERDVSVVFVSNDIIIDFHVMMRARTLVCSMSTISWCAAFFSECIEVCYMPDHTKTAIYPVSTCLQPIVNTVLYNIV